MQLTTKVDVLTVLLLDSQHTIKNAKSIIRPIIGGHKKLIKAPNSCFDKSVDIAKMNDTKVDRTIKNMPLVIVIYACTQRLTALSKCGIH